MSRPLNGRLQALKTNNEMPSKGKRHGRPFTMKVKVKQATPKWPTFVMEYNDAFRYKPRPKRNKKS